MPRSEFDTMTATADVVSDSPFDPTIPVIRPGSPEFVAFTRSMNRKER